MSESKEQRQARTLGNQMQPGNVLGHDLMALINRRLVRFGGGDNWLHMGNVILNMDSVARMDADRADDGSVRFRVQAGTLSHGLIIPAGREGNIGEAIGDGAVVQHDEQTMEPDDALADAEALANEDALPDAEAEPFRCTVCEEVIHSIEGEWYHGGDSGDSDATADLDHQATAPPPVSEARKIHHCKKCSERVAFLWDAKPVVGGSLGYWCHVGITPHSHLIQLETTEQGPVEPEANADAEAEPVSTAAAPLCIKCNRPIFSVLAGKEWLHQGRQGPGDHKAVRFSDPLIVCVKCGDNITKHGNVWLHKTPHDHKALPVESEPEADEPEAEKDPQVKFSETGICFYCHEEIGTVDGKWMHDGFEEHRHEAKPKPEAEPEPKS